MASEPKHRITVQDYLAVERREETRSEYLDGEMFAMAGASHEYNVIVTNLVAALRPQLRARGCTLYANDMRVRTPTDFLAYPDVMALCGERRFDDPRRDTVLNPTMIIEVLSPSTEEYDRGTKLPHFREIPSLSEALLIAQDRPHVEHYIRQAKDRWLLIEINDGLHILELPSIGCKLALSDVYEDVFEDAPGLT
ncbi:MAG TPA: Uma2 family endonuclease [Thermoanaerobaculia bacterium]|jgi:Uma2 family endonuclease